MPREAAVRVDPPGLLQRTAGDGAGHAGFAVELDYANYEVLVIDNNTKDPAVWGPVDY